MSRLIEIVKYHLYARRTNFESEAVEAMAPFEESVGGAFVIEKGE